MSDRTDQLGPKDVVRSPAREVIRRFMRHKLAMTGLIVFLVITLMAVFAPVVTQYDPNQIDLRARSQGPSLDHWFGTDRTGRDLYTRTVYAGRISLLVGVLAVAISVALALILGSCAGFFGGKTDTVIMRFTDVMMTFPPVVIFVAVAAAAGPGLRNTILVIGLLFWMIPCRLVRAKILSVRETEYITAARAIGVPTGRIVRVHAIPNVLDVIIVYATLGIANAILLEAGLSFLGVGIQPPTSSWGNMLNVARNINILESEPWLWIPPGIAIVLTVLAVNLIGDGLRDALDPRSRL
ncbi:MAG TPA: oligopeptide ABC transporter permease [Thermomicrobiales bacterium]|nr:oligopeptide ABC transporter permease [Thermomicrobiales bacterium]